MSDQPPGAGTAAITAAPAHPPAPPQTLRILPRFSVVAALFIVALAGSWQFRSHLSHPDEIDDPVDHHVLPKDPAKSVNPAVLRARGDNALRQHRFAEAIAHYHELMAGDATDVAGLNYRLGLCSEFVGQSDKATASYRLVIGAPAAPPLHFAAQLGMARCLLRLGRAPEARRVLQAPMLDETRQHGVPQAMLIDAYYLLALALARENAAAAPARLAREELASSASSPLETPMYLDDVDTTWHDEPAPAKADRVIIQPRAGVDPAMAFVVERTATASDLLEQLALEGGLKTEWTVAARKSVANRSLHLHLHNWELRDALEHACDFLDVICEFDIDGVRFCAVTEADRKNASAFRRGIAQRALFAALRADAAHPHTAASLLELGNLEASQDRWNEAVYWYGRVGLDHSSSSHAVIAHFNMAQVHLDKHEATRARKALFHVIDQAPGHELALRAGIQLGQLLLQENDAGQAIVYLRRTQQFAGKSPHFAVATLMLAAAQLHHEEFDAARRSLAQGRAALDRDPFKKTAAFLDTYARYRLAIEAAEGPAGQRESNELIATLWRNKDESNLGAYGHWLMARAYNELGFWDQAERLLRRALPEAQPPFNIGVDLTLAETLLKKNRRTDATKIFEKWSEAESPFRAKARHHLATLDLEEKRFAECSDWCQKMWVAREYTNKAELLLLWGTALEGAGEFTKAAQCFAGKAPDS